jgi:hypothetical protein
MEALEQVLDGWGRNGYTTEAALLFDESFVVVNFRDKSGTLVSSLRFRPNANGKTWTSPKEK